MTSEKSDDPICAICTFSMTEEKAIDDLQCGHTFHEMCWEHYVTYEENKTQDAHVLCPCCRVILYDIERADPNEEARTEEARTNTAQHVIDVATEPNDCADTILIRFFKACGILMLIAFFVFVIYVFVTRSTGSAKTAHTSSYD